jgi:hypothetical protein
LLVKQEKTKHANAVDAAVVANVVQENKLKFVIL